MSTDSGGSVIDPQSILELAAYRSGSKRKVNTVHDAVAVCIPLRIRRTRSRHHQGSIDGVDLSITIHVTQQPIEVMERIGGSVAVDVDANAVITITRIRVTIATNALGTKVKLDSSSVQVGRECRCRNKKRILSVQIKFSYLMRPGDSRAVNTSPAPKIRSMLRT